MFQFSTKKQKVYVSTPEGRINKQGSRISFILRLYSFCGYHYFEVNFILRYASILRSSSLLRLSFFVVVLIFQVILIFEDVFFTDVFVFEVGLLLEVASRTSDYLRLVT